MATFKDLEDLDVLNVAVSIKNAGDGLSDALSIGDIELRHFETVLVLLECEVVDIQSPRVKDTDGVQRKHVLKAGRATIVEGKAYDKALDEMSRKLERAAGVDPLPGLGKVDD